MIDDVPESDAAREEQDRYAAVLIRNVAFVLFMASLMMLVCHLLTACNPAASAADADYLAKQLACVDQATTKDEATACRNAVKAAWAAKDGGVE